MSVAALVWLRKLPLVLTWQAPPTTAGCKGRHRRLLGLHHRRRADQTSQGGPRPPASRGPASAPRPQEGQDRRAQGARTASTRQTGGQRRRLSCWHPAGGGQACRLVECGPAQGRRRRRPHLWQQGAARRQRWRCAGGSPRRTHQRRWRADLPAGRTAPSGASGGCWPVGVDAVAVLWSPLQQ